MWWPARVPTVAVLVNDSFVCQSYGLDCDDMCNDMSNDMLKDMLDDLRNDTPDDMRTGPCKS
jgi:hypothetical protein